MLALLFLLLVSFSHGRALPCPPPQINATLASYVGAISESFSVSSGAFVYQTPIQVPPGTRGQAPHLVLEFNSQRTGSALYGTGVTVNGLISIHRCPRTLVQDGYVRSVHIDAGDAFCLNSDRLINVSGTYGADGTEYRTEVDGFLRIFSRSIQGDGPEWFETFTRDGGRLEFGFTEDSRIEAQNSDSVNVWAINHQADSTGNYMNYTYIESTAVFMIHYINYTGNFAADLEPYNSVVFLYEDRPDETTIYVNGSPMTTSSRIQAIQTYNMSSLVTMYSFVWEQSLVNGASRIMALYQCDAIGVCLPPTNFTWTEPSEGPFMNANGVAVSISDALAMRNIDQARVILGDFDGNGRTDQLYVAGFGATATPSMIYYNYLAPDGTTNWVPKEGPAFIVHGWIEQASVDLSRISIVDMNADGLADIYRINGGYLEGANLTDTIWLSQPDGTFTPIDGPLTIISMIPTFESLDISRVRLADFNGDKLVDVFYLNGFGGPAVPGDIWIQELNGTFSYFPSSTPPLVAVHAELAAASIDLKRVSVMDIVGSGLSGFYVVEFNSPDTKPAPDSMYINEQQPGSIFSPTWYRLNGPTTDVSNNTLELSSMLLSAISFGDLNGDGNVDVVQLLGYDSPTPLPLNIYVNQGDGSWDPTWQGPTIPLRRPLIEANFDVATLRVVDVNFDGFTDFYWLLPSNVSTSDTVFLSQGNGTFVSVSGAPTILPPGDLPLETAWTLLQSIRFGDLNGDGALDRFHLVPNDPSTGEPQNATFWVAPWRMPLLTGVQNGLGASLQIFYTPMTNTSTYTKEVSAVYPVRDVQGNFEVVTSVLRSDGLGGVTTTVYSYSGQQFHQQGLGLLGMRTQDVVQVENGRRTHTEFSQEWQQRLHRQPLQVIEYVNDSLLSVAYSNPDAESYFSGVFVIHVLTENSSQWDLDGTWISNTTISRSFDEYNNPFFMQSTLIDALHEETNNESRIYTPNTDGYWILDMFNQSLIIKQADSSLPQSRLVYQEYNESIGLLISKTVDPAQPFATTQTFVLDIFGNAISSTLSGINVTSRTTWTNYDDFGRFKVNITNSLGQSIFMQYDARFGVVTNSTDLNGLSTLSWYDGLGRILVTQAPDCSLTSTARLWIEGEEGDLAPPLAVLAIAVTNPDGTVTHTFVDMLQRTIRTAAVGFNGSYVFVDKIYDQLGRVIQVSEPYFQGTTPVWTNSTVDVLDRPTLVVRPLGGTTTFSYAGAQGISYDAYNRSFTELRDAMNRLYVSIDATGNLTKFGYDSLGNQIKVLDAYGNAITRGIDVRGRVLWEDDPDRGNTSYEYDAFDQLRQVSFANGNWETRDYDQLGRLVNYTTSDGPCWDIYDSASNGIGLLYKRICNDETKYEEVRQYDNLTRLASVVSTSAKGLESNYTTSITYDYISRLSTIRYPGMRVSMVHVYNEFGYMYQLIDANTSQVYEQIDSMDASGKVTQQTLGNGVITQRAYDIEHRVLAIKSVSKLGTALQLLGYQWDLIGHLNSRADFIQGTNDTVYYDDLYRIKIVQPVDSTPLTLYYDAIGNIVYKSDVGNYHYGALPHAVSAIGDGTSQQQFEYDPMGNMQVGRNGMSFMWNGRNQASSITSGASSQFLYNPDGSMLWRADFASGITTETYSPSGSAFEEISQNGTLMYNKYYIGSSAVMSLISGVEPSLMYLLRDHLGSVVGITNDLGALIEARNYDAFGQLTNRTQIASFDLSTDHGFTDHIDLPALGLVHMRGRVYDPVLGRFISADPTIQFPNFGQSYNRYSYVLNCPLSFTDPSGFGILSFIGRGARAVARGVGAVFRGVVHAVEQIGHFLERSALARTVVQVVLNVALTFECGPYCAIAVDAAFSAYVTKVEGGSWTDALKSAAITAATDTAFHIIGDYYDPTIAAHTITLTKDVSRALLHGLVGGVSSAINGGKFLPGFASAALPSLFDAYSWTLGSVGTGIADTIAGGIASKLTGGTFQGGAMTAFRGFLYNTFRQTMCYALTAAQKELIYRDYQQATRMNIISWLLRVLPANIGNKLPTILHASEWDYKQSHYNRGAIEYFQWDDFGNVDYGATGNAVGFSQLRLLQGAGVISTFYTHGQQGYFFQGENSLHGDTRDGQLAIRYGYWIAEQIKVGKPF